MSKKYKKKEILKRKIDSLKPIVTKIPFRREFFFLMIAFLILYILCFSNWMKGNKRWKENIISFSEKRTSTSSYQEDSTKTTQDYDSLEDQYLFADGVVDTMQEQTLLRSANQNYVRKRLTNASKGIGVGDEIEGSQKIQFAEKTEITDDKIKISYRDYEVLQRIVEAEATGLDEKSKILIANVLFNRVRSSQFPDTIEEVVFQEVNGVVQFQPVSDGRYETVEVQDDTVEAVNKAILGADYSQGALYFLARSGSRKSSITWFDQNLTWLFEYEGHEFYK